MITDTELKFGPPSGLWTVNQEEEEKEELYDDEEYEEGEDEEFGEEEAGGETEGEDAGKGGEY